MRTLAAALAVLSLCLPISAFAATPKPKPPARIDVTKIQPKELLPKKALHDWFIVEVNKLGQVTRVRSTKSSGDPTFDAQTYGNALQAFIRTPQGRAVVGVYRLTYDYNPKTTRVRRDVAIISVGGVDPNAKGAALDMMSKAHPHTPPPTVLVKPAPHPAPSVNIERMPNLDNVIHPSPKPSSH